MTGYSFRAPTDLVLKEVVMPPYPTDIYGEAYVAVVFSTNDVDFDEGDEIVWDDFVRVLALLCLLRGCGSCQEGEGGGGDHGIFFWV